MSTILGMIPSILMMTAPILITAIGGMISEKSGVTNIALEGLMGFGGCAAAASHTLMEAAGMPHGASICLALFIGSCIGGIFSIIHAVAAIDLSADQTISGTGITLLADGVTIFASQILFHGVQAWYAGRSFWNLPNSNHRFGCCLPCLVRAFQAPTWNAP